MLSGLVSLSGDWVLRKKGSDYLPELEDHDGIPPVANLVNSNSVFRIIQIADIFDEVYIKRLVYAPYYLLELLYDCEVYAATHTLHFLWQIHFVHDAESSSPTTVYHHLGKLNFETIAGKSVVVSIIVHVDRDFKEFSVLRIGPAKHQRR